MRRQVVAALGQAPSGQLESRILAQIVEIVGIRIAAGIANGYMIGRHFTPPAGREASAIGSIAATCAEHDTPEQSAFVARWASEQDRVETMHRRNVAVSLLARAALRALLAEQTGRTDWQLLRTALGKPFVVAPSGASGPAVSLSHTRGMVAIALAADGALGIDIERHRSRNFIALAEQAFGMNEYAEVSAGGEEAFYRIWTLREAVAKATGEGLALAGNGRDLLVPDPAGSGHRTDHAGRTWHLRHRMITPDCTLAIAHADTAEDPWTVRWITLDPA